MTSGQEMERAYSYNPRARTGQRTLGPFYPRQRQFACVGRVHLHTCTCVSLYDNSSANHSVATEIDTEVDPDRTGCCGRKS